MQKQRKIIWAMVIIFTAGVGVALLLLDHYGAQFSVQSESVGRMTTGVRARGSGRYPEFSDQGVGVSERSTAKDGVTLRQILPFIPTNEGTVVGLRSLGLLYPDGTSAQYEVLLAASTTARRIIIGKSGVVSDLPTQSLSKPTIPFPLNFPDSGDALLQLTANPYFLHAQIIGIALYYDIATRSWNYLIRTDLGDVSIPLHERKK